MNDQPSGYDNPKTGEKNRIDGKLPPGKPSGKSGDDVIQIRLSIPPWLRGLHKNAGFAWGMMALVIVLAISVIWWQGRESSPAPVAITPTMPKIGLASATPAPAPIAPATPVSDAAYAAWKEAVNNPSSWTTPDAVITSALPAPSWWANTFTLPPESMARSALQMRLPLGTQILSLKAIGYQKLPEGIAVDYEAKLQFSGPLYGVLIQPIPVPDMARGQFAGADRLLVASSNLPPGFYYDTQGKQLLMSPTSVYPVKFQVLKAAKVKGTWQVQDAVPFPFDHNPALEKRLLAEYPNGGAHVVRGEDELRQEDQIYQQAVKQFDTRIFTIKSDIAANTDRLMKSLPPYPSKPRYDNSKFGGSGSGEPTRTAGRTVGGAAVGAGLGAAFGQSGEAAGIGAGAGLLAGLLYDGISKSNDKKKFEQQQARYNSSVKADYNQAVSAYNATKKQAQQQAIDYATQQINGFKNELYQQATQRETLLQQQG